MPRSVPGQADELPAAKFNHWSLFTVDRDSRARLRKVAIGHMNDEEVEVLGGLNSGEKVLLHPSDKVGDGVKVAGRT